MTYSISPIDQVDRHQLIVGLLLAGISILYNVVADVTAAVVFGGVPGQVAGLCPDLRHHDVPRRKRTVWRSRGDVVTGFLRKRKARRTPFSKNEETV